MHYLDKVSKNSTGVLIYKDVKLNKFKDNIIAAFAVLVGSMGAAYISYVSLGVIDALKLLISLCMIVSAIVYSCIKSFDYRETILSFNKTGIIYFRRNNFVLIPMKSIESIEIDESDNKCGFIVKIQENELVAEVENDRSRMTLDSTFGPDKVKMIVMDDFRISKNNFHMIRDYMTEVLSKA